MIEITGTLRINDDGEVWWCDKDQSRPIIGRGSNPIKIIQEIIERHSLNRQTMIKQQYNTDNKQ